MRFLYWSGLIVAALISGCGSQREEEKAPSAGPAAASGAETSAPPAAAAPVEAAELFLSSAEIVARTRPAVVLVRTSNTQGVGFVVSPDGIVVTTYQLVKDSSVIGVKLASGDIYPATEIFATDPLKNLALLRISGFKLPVVELQDSDKTAAGQEVIIVTDPAGAGTMVSTTVSAISDISVLDEKRRGHQLLQFQAMMPPSSNGAPVLDRQGKVVGMTASFGKQNVAVPSNYIAGLLNNPQPIALRPGAQPPETPVPPAGSTPAVAESEATGAPLPAQAAAPSLPGEKSAPPSKTEVTRATPVKPKAPRPAPVARSLRQVQRVYVSLAAGGQIRSDRTAGPAICKPKLEEALQDEDFVIAPSADRADAVLRVSGTHKTGCEMPLGCGREIMQYRASLTNREGDFLWQRSGHESAVGFEEVCRDLAEELADSIGELRDG